MKLGHISSVLFVISVLNVKSLSSHFHPGVGPSWNLLCDCKNFADGSFAALDIISRGGATKVDTQTNTCRDNGELSCVVRTRHESPCHVPRVLLTLCIFTIYHYKTTITVISNDVLIFSVRVETKFYYLPWIVLWFNSYPKLNVVARTRWVQTFYEKSLNPCESL